MWAETNQPSLFAAFFARVSLFLLKISNIVVNHDEIKIELKAPQRSGEGNYTLQLVNCSGRTERIISIKVADVPAPLENLPVIAMGANGCHFYWSPPKDDGGAPVKKYILEKREKDGNWTLAAEILAGLTEDKQYQFRVSAVSQAGQSVPSSPTDLLRIIGNFEYTDFENETL
ncbi:hypothetical protein RvY_02062 [Ramazzottius varieornatus]|uniref:Fibronectin type-III domain-containing protein n=1 Tax=Ramazzottius varieornatus TaxID=947166 RepID=A0A1D1UTL0_RAMVA|nr:hypothetical protein RvY_02062 [Ramazzottius varieornatus]